MGKVALRVGGYLQDLAQFTLIDHAAGFGKEDIVTTGAVDGDGHTFAVAELDYFVGFGQTERERFLSPDRFDTGVYRIDHDSGPVTCGGTKAHEVGPFGLQHLTVVGIDSISVQTPAIGEDLALLRVWIGAGDQVGKGGGSVGGAMAVGHEELTPLCDLVVECTAHPSKTDDGGSESFSCHACFS